MSSHKFPHDKWGRPYHTLLLPEKKDIEHGLCHPITKDEYNTILNHITKQIDKSHDFVGSLATALEIVFPPAKENP